MKVFFSKLSTGKLKSIKPVQRSHQTVWQTMTMDGKQICSLGVLEVKGPLQNVTHVRGLLHDAKGKRRFLYKWKHHSAADSIVGYIGKLKSNNERFAMQLLHSTYVWFTLANGIDMIKFGFLPWNTLSHLMTEHTQTSEYRLSELIIY